jgi:hypothetical protein
MQKGKKIEKEALGVKVGEADGEAGLAVVEEAVEVTKEDNEVVVIIENLKGSMASNAPLSWKLQLQAVPYAE